MAVDDAAEPGRGALAAPGSPGSSGPSPRERLAVRVVTGAFLVALFAYAGVIVFGASPLRGSPAWPDYVPGHVMFGTDSAGYYRASHHVWWERGFFGAPMIYPLLLQVLVRNLVAVVLVQTALYGAAWIWLARVSARFAARPTMRILIAAILFALALSPELLLWTASISTETLSIAHAVAFLAALVSVAEQPTLRRWTVLVGLVVLGALLRDSNTAIALLVLPAGVVAAVRFPAWRRFALASAVVCTVVALGVSSLANIGSVPYAGDDCDVPPTSDDCPPRWLYPLMDTIVIRVVRDEGSYDWFVARGMPDAAVVKKYTDVYELDIGEFKEPQFDEFREWIYSEGRTSYLWFLVTHPRYTLWRPVLADEQIFLPGSDSNLAPETRRSYGAYTGSTPGAIYGWFGAAAFWRWLGLVEVWALLVVLALSGLPATPLRRDGRLRLALGVGFAVGLLHAVANYHGDAAEVGRHAIAPNAQLRAILWVTTLLAIDRWWSRRRSRQVPEGDLVADRSG